MSCRANGRCSHGPLQLLNVMLPHYARGASIPALASGSPLSNTRPDQLLPHRGGPALLGMGRQHRMLEINPRKRKGVSQLSQPWEPGLLTHMPAVKYCPLALKQYPELHSDHRQHYFSQEAGLTGFRGSMSSCFQCLWQNIEQVTREGRNLQQVRE